MSMSFHGLRESPKASHSSSRNDGAAAAAAVSPTCSTTTSPRMSSQFYPEPIELHFTKVPLQYNTAFPTPLCIFWFGKILKNTRRWATRTRYGLISETHLYVMNFDHTIRKFAIGRCTFH